MIPKALGKCISKGKSVDLLTNDWSPIGIMEKIDYLELRLFNQKINFFLGELTNLTFGHGYLLNKYGNNYNYPIDRNVGIKLKAENSNGSISYNSFISNLDHFSQSSGLLGNHISFLISDSFPLRIGFGHIVDLDQFIDYKNYIDKSRKISAFEIDFDFPLFNILTYVIHIYWGAHGAMAHGPPNKYLLNIFIY